MYTCPDCNIQMKLVEDYQESIYKCPKCRCEYDENMLLEYSEQYDNETMELFEHEE